MCPLAFFPKCNRQQLLPRAAQAASLFSTLLLDPQNPNVRSSTCATADFLWLHSEYVEHVGESAKLRTPYRGAHPSCLKKDELELAGAYVRAAPRVCGGYLADLSTLQNAASDGGSAAIRGCLGVHMVVNLEGWMRGRAVRRMGIREAQRQLGEKLTVSYGKRCGAVRTPGLGLWEDTLCVLMPDLISKLELDLEEARRLLTTGGRYVN